MVTDPSTRSKGYASRLKRARHPLPTFIRCALEERRLTDAYRARTAYQQNDYVGWITRAKREETSQRRLAQMLDELWKGDRYMKMGYKPTAGRPR